MHPFFVATQAHPELKSRPTRPHPLFAAFIGAALDYNDQERLPVEIPDDAGGPAELAAAGPVRRMSVRPVAGFEVLSLRAAAIAG